MGGNVLVVYVIRKHPHMKEEPSNYFMLSLACSDFTLGIIYSIYNVSHMKLTSIKNTLGKYKLKQICMIFVSSNV